MTDRYIYGGDGSHWAGCEDTHWDCKIKALERENEMLLAKLEAAFTAAQVFKFQRDEANDRYRARLAAEYRAMGTEET